MWRKQYKFLLHHTEAPASPTKFLLTIVLKTEIEPTAAALKIVTP
jgi:hypothetical protein